MTFFIALLCCRGLVKELWWVRQSSGTTGDNGQCWLVGFPGSGMERKSIIADTLLLAPYQNLHLLPALTQGSAKKHHNCFAWKKLLRLKGHPCPQGTGQEALMP